MNDEYEFTETGHHFRADCRAAHMTIFPSSPPLRSLRLCVEIFPLLSNRRQPATLGEKAA